MLEVIVNILFTKINIIITENDETMKYDKWQVLE